LVALRGVHLLAHGAVPLFLFMAAYLQATAGRETVREHLNRRVFSVWLPVILWMAAALIYRLVDQGPSVGLWRDLLLFNVSGQFYFVWLLLFFGVAFVWADRLPERWLTPLLVVAFVANLATIGWYSHLDSIGGLLSTLAYRNPLAWIFFWALGYRLGRAGAVQVSARTTVLAAIGMALAAAIYFVRGVDSDTWPVSYFGVTVFIFSACGMLIYPRLALALLRYRPVARPLAGLSRYAFAIYLVHMPLVMGFGTKELLGDGAAWSNYWLLLHANVAVGLLVSLAFVREIDKASPRLARLALGIRGRAARVTIPGRPRTTSAAI
jgi:peptidoglycan/LPS O-acetylase OafA/YrhL